MGGKAVDAGLLVLRLGVGALCVARGQAQVFGGPEMWRALGAYSLAPFNIDSGHVAVGGAAAFVQFLGGVCLALGAFFRPAAALLTLVAAGALAARWKRDVPFVDWAAQAYAGVACVALLLSGPGRFAVRKG